MRYGTRIGHESGIAPMKKNSPRKRVIAVECQRTARV